MAGARCPVEVTVTLPLMLPLPPRAPVSAPLPTLTTPVPRRAAVLVVPVPLPMSSVPPLMLVGPVQLLRVPAKVCVPVPTLTSVPVPAVIAVSACDTSVRTAVQRTSVDRREVVGPDGQGAVEVADVQVAGQRTEVVAVVAVGIGQVNGRGIAGGVGIGDLVVGGGIVHDAEGQGRGGGDLIVAVPADSSELGLVGGKADPDVRRALVSVVASVPPVPLSLASVSSSLVPPPNARE